MRPNVVFTSTFARLIHSDASNNGSHMEKLLLAWFFTSSRWLLICPRMSLIQGQGHVHEGVRRLLFKKGKKWQGAGFFFSPVFPANKIVDLKPFTKRVSGKKAWTWDVPSIVEKKESHIVVTGACTHHKTQLRGEEESGSIYDGGTE